MPGKDPYARIAITLPPETLRAADELAARNDRSRSWIIAEAIRQYVATQPTSAPADDRGTRLGASRTEQLRRDVALSPEARVLESEEIAMIGESRGQLTPPRTFSSYDAFLEYLHQRESR